MCVPAIQPKKKIADTASTPCTTMRRGSHGCGAEPKSVTLWKKKCNTSHAQPVSHSRPKLEYSDRRSHALTAISYWPAARAASDESDSLALPGATAEPVASFELANAACQIARIRRTPAVTCSL